MEIRRVAADDSANINLIAIRMRETLIEVEGEARGANLYSQQWLEDRIRWHLDASKVKAEVVVGMDESGVVVGHTIYRIELAGPASFGLISTTYVIPSARRAGWAATFLQCAHRWFHDQGIEQACTWTSASNTALIRLYEKHGYAIVDHGPNDLTGTPMVKLGVLLNRATAELNH